MRRRAASGLGLVFATALLVLAAVSGPAATRAAAASDQDDPLPRVPPGFAVVPYAAVPGGLLTSLAFGPDTRDGDGSRLYITDFAGGRVLVVDDVNGIGGQPAVFATGFNSPLGVVTAGDGTLYVSDSEAAARPGPFGNRVYGRVWRVRDINGDGLADSQEVVLKDLPQGRHNTNGMAFGPDGMLYVTNGNSTDDGLEGGPPEVEPWSGSVVRVDPAATEVSLADLPEQDTLVAHGMRNLYDLAFSPYDPSELFIPMNGADDAREGSTGGTPGVDEIEDSDDLLYRTDVDDTRQARDPETGEPLFDEDGDPILEPVIDDFGFPSCLYNVERQGDLEPYDNPNPQVIEQFGPCPTGEVPRPVMSFGLHVSADGLAFQTTDAWGEEYRNDLFVAEFGNFFGDEVTGHKVVRVELDATGENVVRHSEFLSGVLPLDVTFDADGAMYVADFAGAVLKVTKVADVPDVVEVTADAFQFIPQAVVIPEGTTIRWVNRERFGEAHHVFGQLAARSDATTDEAEEINSGHLAVGDSYEHRFDQPGTFVYTCVVDPVHTAVMHGNITVVPAGS